MTTIKESTYQRFIEVSRHPKAKKTPAEMVRTCIDHGIDFDDYAAALRLQIDMIDAFDRYIAAQPKDSMTINMRVCAAAAAQALGLMTQEDPLPGADVANMVANDLIVVFSHTLAKNVAWKEPDFVKTPTHDGNQTFN